MLTADKSSVNLNFLRRHALATFLGLHKKEPGEYHHQLKKVLDQKNLSPVGQTPMGENQVVTC